MKSIIHLTIAVMLAALFTTSGLGKDPAKTAKMKDVLAREHKAMLLSHLRANPEPRSEAIYNEYAARKQAQKTATSAKLD